MYLRRLVCALTVALVGAAVASTTPAVSAYKGCGRAGYAYAGLLSDRGPSGVTATLTSLAEPLVQKGHVGAWVGVGAPGQGPGGTNEWIQVGLNRIAGRPAKLYYEVATASGIRYVELDSNVLPGRRYRVAVLEVAHRPDVWRVWVDGRPGSDPIYLPQSHRRLTPMAIAENWDGGAPSCNRFKYRFRQVALAGSPGGSWSRFRAMDAQVMQDSGYRILRVPTGGFVAVTAPPPPQPATPDPPQKPAPPPPRPTASEPSTPAPAPVPEPPAPPAATPGEPAVPGAETTPYGPATD
jgi:hypothetical protein